MVKSYDFMRKNGDHFLQILPQFKLHYIDS